MGEYVISKDGQNYLPQDKEYIKGKGILVGCFNEQQINNRDDKIATQKMMDATGVLRIRKYDDGSVKKDIIDVK